MDIFTGERIRKARKTSGLSNKAFAAACGVTPTTLRSWIEGKTRPNPTQETALYYTETSGANPLTTALKVRRLLDTPDLPGSLAGKCETLLEQFNKVLAAMQDHIGEAVEELARVRISTRALESARTKVVEDLEQRSDVREARAAKSGAK